MRWLIILAAVFTVSLSGAQTAEANGTNPFETVREATMAKVKEAIVVLAAERRLVRKDIRAFAPGPDRVAAFKRQFELNVAIFKLQRNFFQAKNDRGMGRYFFVRLGRYRNFAQTFISAS